MNRFKCRLYSKYVLESNLPLESFFFFYLLEVTSALLTPQPCEVMKGNSRYMDVLLKTVPRHRSSCCSLVAGSRPFPAIFIAPTIISSVLEILLRKIPELRLPLWLQTVTTDILFKWAPVCVDSPINSLFILNPSSGNFLWNYSLTSFQREQGKHQLLKGAAFFMYSLRTLHLACIETHLSVQLSKLGHALYVQK